MTETNKTIQFNLMQEDVEFLEKFLREYLFDWFMAEIEKESAFTAIPREIFVAKRLYYLVNN